ncbi:BRCT domain containing protein [Asbolus verrucosus]|uniref:BRCT domain containing protein n=1 Tax=Asbolus verrucosus TaxID=1661398 RepID=A0A482W0G8_ASBVE|nr:BRCT domain containing protein [Asbolus verrucosus]
MTQNYATEKLSLSPISLDNNRILGPIEIHQKSKFSPLTIVKKTQSQRSLHGTPKQKSILSYIRPSQESQETPPSLTGRPCIACSRVARDQVMAISALTNKKLASYSSSFSSKVTHLIVSVDGRNRIKDHTIKSVSAIAAGIWVLSYGWVRECLARNCLVPEEPYEVLDISGAPGPKLARLNRRTNPLLKDFKVHVLPPFQSATKSDLENILRMLGAKVVDSLEDLLDKENYICLVIGDRRPTEECPVDMFDGVVEVFRVITVDVDWLSRSVGQYTLHGLRPFTLCSEDNIDDLEYPPELLSNNVQISFLPSTSSVPSL